MSDIASQAHSKFKVFAGDLAVDNTIGGLADEVASFAKNNAIAAKSIGVEYLESAKRLIITLGYREGEESYPIQLRCVPLGRADAFSSDFTALEQAMEKVADAHKNIICHELYVTASGDFFMVLMMHQA